MSAIEVQLQHLGILSGITRVCEEAGLTLRQLSEVLSSALKEDTARSGVPDIMTASVDEANRMLSEAMQEMGDEELSWGEAIELCPD